MNPIAAALRANPSLSDAAIAAICGVSRARVQQVREANAIPARCGKGRPSVEVACQACGLIGQGFRWLTAHRKESPECNRRKLFQKHESRHP